VVSECARGVIGDVETDPVVGVAGEVAADGFQGVVEMWPGRYQVF